MFSFGRIDNNTLITNSLFSYHENNLKKDEEPIDIDTLLEEQEEWDRNFGFLKRGVKKEEIERLSYKQLLKVCKKYKIKELSWII